MPQNVGDHGFMITVRRSMKARRSGVLRCGHYVMVGARIISLEGRALGVRGLRTQGPAGPGPRVVAKDWIMPKGSPRGGMKEAIAASVAARQTRLHEGSPRARSTARTVING
jgi:hypothetical protein